MASASAEAQQAAAAQEHALTSLASQIQQLTMIVAQLAPPSSPPAPALAASSPSPLGLTAEPCIGAPERYAGEPENCNPFLTNCSIFFVLQPLTFATEAAKVAFTINQLTGRARLWGTAEWERQTAACATFTAFSAELRKVFGQGLQLTDVSGLLSVCQGEQSVFDFSVDFRTKARLSNWNQGALRDAFLHGLADYIKDELVSHALPSSLDDVIALATNINLRIRARKREKRQSNPTHSALSASRSSSSHSVRPIVSHDNLSSHPEPMQLGRTSLSPEERA